MHLVGNASRSCSTHTCAMASSSDGRRPCPWGCAGEPARGGYAPSPRPRARRRRSGSRHTELHGASHAPPLRCTRRIVVGLERDHFVARLAEREQRRRALRRAGRDEHLGVGVVRRSYQWRWCAAIARRSSGTPAPGGYWLSPARMALTAASSTSCGPSESHLPQVDRAGRHRRRRHLGEDRGAEALELDVRYRARSVTVFSPPRS